MLFVLNIGYQKTKERADMDKNEREKTAGTASASKVAETSEDDDDNF